MVIIEDPFFHGLKHTSIYVLDIQNLLRNVYCKMKDLYYIPIDIDMNCLVLTVASYVDLSYLLMSIRNPEQAMSFFLAGAFLKTTVCM